MTDSQTPPDAPPPPEPTPETISQFLTLYNAARKEHQKARRNASSTSPAHVAAVTFAREHSLPRAADLLEAVVLSRTGHPEEAWNLVADILSDLPSALHGQAHHIRGFVLDDLKKFSEALAEYEAALASPGYDTPGDTLNNLGLVYYNKKDFDRAIEFYPKALNTLGYDTPGLALNNIGLAYYNKNDYDRAIEYYQKALNTPGYDTPGSALNNLGLAYSYKKDYGRAIVYYQQALATPGYDTPHLTRLNYAISLRASGRFDEALQQVETVLNEPDSEKSHDRAKFIKSLILSQQAQIPASPSDEALLKSITSPPEDISTDTDSPESHLKAKLRGLDDKYIQYLKKPSSKRNNQFSILRGWSSAVTLLEGSKDGHWHGGGYFLKWQGHGIVIDPGFDFLDNFHDSGFHARELDAVLVSHNHSDHNYDLGSLDDLRYQIYRRSTKETDDGSRRPMLPKYQLVIDEDTAKGFDETDRPHRHSPLRFLRGLAERHHWYGPETTGLPLIIEHFSVEHGEDVPHAVGIRLRLQKKRKDQLVIGYTGDTRYFKGLAENLQGCDILLAHISQPTAEEFNDEKILKDYHLGYNGVTKLIKALIELKSEPKIILIGEFWAGLADLRVELIQGLRLRTGRDNIFPVGLGFHISIPSLEIECTECHKPTHFSKIRISPPTTPFGPLGYLCGNCII